MRRLLIIGGAEEKEGPVLKTFLELAGEKPKLVVLSTASKDSAQVGTDYAQVFRKLGAGPVELLELETRQSAQSEAAAAFLEEAKGIFFTGGDQLRLTSLLCGTKAHSALLAAFEKGTIIAGTSAGASVMSSTMIVGGQDEVEPQRGAVSLAAGLGFLPEAIVDQHFAQRGRIGRLLFAIAQNPHQLGIGIDEDTALLVEGKKARVLGSGSVTIIDGRSMEYVNVSELLPDEPLALSKILLHILPRDYIFSFESRELIF